MWNTEKKSRKNVQVGLLSVRALDNMNSAHRGKRFSRTREKKETFIVKASRNPRIHIAFAITPGEEQRREEKKRSGIK